MRKVLSSNQEVAHYFANSVQSEGKASNFYFETDRDGDCKLFSYGRHFCVARRLSRDVFAFTTRTYGMATSKHLAYARSALSHKTVVHCYDPAASAITNKREAQAAINAQLRDAATERRIQQKTRDGHKARALYLAEQFNSYLAALPENERIDVQPFDVSGLEEMRAAMLREEERKAEEERQRKARAAVAAAEYLADWRKDPTMATQGMMSLPPALRLAPSRGSYHTGGLLPDSGSVGRMVVQTSHGAEIPVSDARALWPVILSVKCGQRTAEEAARLVRRVGVYMLTTINADGSIVVGCHSIAWPEIERMAVALEFITSYRVTLRSKTTGGQHTENMRVWPGADVEQEAARLAASYGADVEQVEAVIACDEVAA
jgi:hypothetical protein